MAWAKTKGLENKMLPIEKIVGLVLIALAVGGTLVYMINRGKSTAPK